MDQRPFITVDRPPLEVFRGEGAQLQKTGEETVSGNQFDRIEYPEEGGIYAHYYDHPYPTKGQPFPEAVQAILVPKKLFRAIAYFIKSHPITCGVFFLLPGFVTEKYVKTFLDHFVRSMAHVIIRPYRFNMAAVERGENPKEYCKSAREVRRAAFLVVSKVREKWREYYGYFIDFFVLIMEWDNAWRFRVQDIFSEVNKEAFRRNPSAEISRVIKVMVSRERGWYEDKGKVVVMGSAVKFALFFMPELKRFLIEFIKELNFDEVKMDLADEYHNYMRPDYDIHGWPMEVRQEKWRHEWAKYTKENPGRLQEGAEKVRQMQEMMALQMEFTKHNGIPFMLICVMKKDGQTVLGMVETPMSLKNFQLREDAIKLLESRNAAEKAAKQVNATGTDKS